MSSLAAFSMILSQVAVSIRRSVMPLPPPVMDYWLAPVPPRISPGRADRKPAARRGPSPRPQFSTVKAQSVAPVSLEDVAATIRRIIDVAPIVSEAAAMLKYAPPTFIEMRWVAGRRAFRLAGMGRCNDQALSVKLTAQDEVDCVPLPLRAAQADQLCTSPIPLPRIPAYARRA
jgi:hypothetical protein